MEAFFQVEIDVRVAAGVMLKNEIRAYWDDEEEEEEDEQHRHFTYEAEERAAIRSFLYATLLQAIPVSQPLALQLLECIRLVAFYDFPSKWEELLPLVAADVGERRDPVRVRGGLLVLQQLFSCFSYRRIDQQHETALRLLLSTTWPLLLPSAAQLLQEGGLAHAEAMELLKVILKIFKTTVHSFRVAAPVLLSSFDEWMQLLDQILSLPVPAAVIAGVDISDREELPAYKVKKWLLNILHRCFSRVYGEQQLLHRRRRCDSSSSRKRSTAVSRGRGREEEEAAAEEALTNRFAAVWGPHFTEQILLLLRRQHAEHEAAAAAASTPGATATHTAALPPPAPAVAAVVPGGAAAAALPPAAAALPAAAAEYTWWLSPRMQNSILQILLEAVSSAQLYSRYIKPNGEFLALNVCLSLLHYSQEDEELWETDSLEFIRRDNDGLDSVYDPREAACEFIRGLVRLRGRDFLEPLYLCMHGVAAEFRRAEEAAAEHAGVASRSVAAPCAAAADAAAAALSAAAVADAPAGGKYGKATGASATQQQQQQMLLPSAAYQRMDAALRLACCMSERLTSKKRQVPVERFINEFVFPLLQHWNKFLRLHAAKVYEQYVQHLCSSNSSNDSSSSNSLCAKREHELLLVPAYQRLLLLLVRDGELPVRVAAAVALRSFLLLPSSPSHQQQQLLLHQQQHVQQFSLSQQQQLRETVVQSLGELTEALFSLMEVVDSEAVLRTVEELAVSYAKEITPHAKNLVKGLATALRHTLLHAQRALAADDSGAEEDAAGAAEAVINALENVLQAVGETPAVFMELSEELCGVFELLLSPGQEDYLEEGLLLLSYMTYYMPPPFPSRLWNVFEGIYVGLCCTGERRRPLFNAVLLSGTPAAAAPAAAAGQTAAAPAAPAAGQPAVAGQTLPVAAGTIETAEEEAWLVSAEQVATPLMNFIVRDPQHFLLGRSLHTGLTYKELLLQIAKKCLAGMHDTEDACIGVQLLCAMISSCAGQQHAADEVLLPSFEMVWDLLLRQHAAARERERCHVREKAARRAAAAAAAEAALAAETATAAAGAQAVDAAGASLLLEQNNAAGRTAAEKDPVEAAALKEDNGETPILETPVKRVFIKFLSTLLVYDVQKTFAILEQLQLSSQIFTYLLNNAAAAETAEQKKLLLVGLTRVLQLAGAAAAAAEEKSISSSAAAAAGSMVVLPACVGQHLEQLMRVIAAAAVEQQQLLKKLKAASAAANSSDWSSDSDADSEQDLAEDQDAEINPKTKELLAKLEAKKWEEGDKDDDIVGEDSDSSSDWEEALEDEFDPSTSALRVKLLDNINELLLLRETLAALPQQLQQMISCWLGQQHLLKLNEILMEPASAPTPSPPSHGLQ